MSAVWKEGPPFQRKRQETLRDLGKAKAHNLFREITSVHYVLHRYKYYVPFQAFTHPILTLWTLKHLSYKSTFNFGLGCSLESDLIRIENKKMCTKKYYVFYYKIIFCSVLGRPFVMAACLKNGDILLLRSYDDVIPQVSTAIYFSCKIYLPLTLG